MRPRIPTLVLFSLALVTVAARQVNRGTLKRTMRVGNITRSYLLHMPASTEETKLPVVLVFHGGQSQARQMERYTGFSDLADRNGFIVVYPEGVDRHWNDGRERAPNVDDVGFIVALIRQLKDTLKIDSKRIYATGISNGGMFSQRLACELSGTIAAVASVAASMPETQFQSCKPSRPISVLMIHGTDDPLIPYGGGTMPAGTLGGNVLPVSQVISYWAGHNRCSRKPISAEMPDRDMQDGTRVRREQYLQCMEGTDVVLYTVQGGGHTLPGGRQYLPERLIGITSRDIDGSQIIWDFFEKHTGK